MDLGLEQESQKTLPINTHRLVNPESGLAIEVDEDETHLTKENAYLNLVRELKTSLAQKNNECEILKIKLDESARVINCINQELNKCKFTVFEMNQDSVRNKERSIKLKNLEERYAKLTNDFVAMGEEYEQFKANLFEQYLAKSNAINNYECSRLNEVEELYKIRSELDKKDAQLTVIEAQMKSLSDENANKDKIINNFKQSMHDLQIAYRKEIDDLNVRLKELTNQNDDTQDQQLTISHNGQETQSLLLNEAIQEDKLPVSEINTPKEEQV